MVTRRQLVAAAVPASLAPAALAAAANEPKSDASPQPPAWEVKAVRADVPPINVEH